MPVKKLLLYTWHVIIGYIGKDRIDHLESNVEGAIIAAGGKAPRKNKCETCALLKSKEQPIRKYKANINTPFGEIAIDAVEFSLGFNSYRFLLHAYDLDSHSYFVKTYISNNQ